MREDMMKVWGCLIQASKARCALPARTGSAHLLHRISQKVDE